MRRSDDPVPEAIQLLEQCKQYENVLKELEEKRDEMRREIGKVYFRLRSLAQIRKLGRDPETGKFWLWLNWVEAPPKCQFQGCAIVYQEV